MRRHFGFFLVLRLHFFLKTSDSRYPFLLSTPLIPHERRIFGRLLRLTVLFFWVWFLYHRQRFGFAGKELILL